MPYIFRFTKEFVKNQSNLPEHLKNLFKVKGDLFFANPFESSLKTHKLNGKLKDYWAFSVNHKYRVIFLIEADVITFISIGRHDIYNRF